jgi:Undecaprenyl-phosphate galactose phosphotransferase WbaP
VATPQLKPAVTQLPAHVLLPRISETVRTPWLTGATLLASDLLALILAGSLSVSIWYLIERKLDPGFYLTMSPLLAIFLIAYAAAGLYPGVGLNPVEELRRLTVSTSVVYASLAAITFLSREGVLYSRAVFLLAWAQSVILAPVLRSYTRSYFSRRSWWGHPAIVFGADAAGDAVVEALQREPQAGLKPLAIFDERSGSARSIRGVPVFRDLSAAPQLARQCHAQCAILTVSQLPQSELLRLLTREGATFSRIIIVPELAGLASLWVEASDINGILGLEIRQRLLLPGALLVKRLIDLALTLTLGLLLSPLIVLIGLTVKLTSRGPVFFGHRRYGKDGRPFTAWKFRSMVQNADAVLFEYLTKHPSLRQEWERNHKLRNDPRITWIGRLLRHTSLDELPQLWNALKQEMSLVGPRPIVQDEIQRYGEDFLLYQRVTPGITGLWQVSGRNNLSYEQRVSLDSYYVRNWSIWLDLYVIARTIKVVLKGDGAY